MDRRRFSTIAHSQHAFASPVSPSKARRLLEVAGVRPGATVLDVGAGFGAWSALAVQMGANVLAIEPNPEFVARGRALEPEIRWIEAAYSAETVDAGSQDVVLCIGSSHAVGTLPQAVEEVRRVLKPGGRALIGDGYWKREPDPGYLAVLGAEPDEMPDLASLGRLLAPVAYLTTANADEWDEYEGLYRSAMLEWLAHNPNDPDAAEFKAHSDRWFDAYVRWGRETLGFAFLVLA